jgi:ligand-binding sensor protein
MRCQLFNLSGGLVHQKKDREYGYRCREGRHEFVENVFVKFPGYQ